MADSELLLEKYQNKSLCKGFIHWIEHGFTNASKHLKTRIANLF